MNPEFEIDPEQATMILTQIQACAEGKAAGVRASEAALRAYQQHLEELDAIFARSPDPEPDEAAAAPPPPGHLVPAGKIPSSSSSLLYG